MSRRKAREFALQLLFQLDFTNSELNDDIWNEFWTGTDVDNETKDFALSLVTGTQENIGTLDDTITKTADNWSVDRMAVVDRNILRAAAYELFYRDDIPHAVTINEAVEIAKKFSSEDSSLFINGILDKIHRLKANTS